MSSTFGPVELLKAYRRGVFPMAETREDPDLFLIDPDERGILPLQGFHVPKRLARTVRQDPYMVTSDQAFGRVMEGCAASTQNRDTTWINASILNLYSALHRKGHAHSIECWQDDQLVGGLYMVSPLVEPSSARACFRVQPMRQKLPLCISSRASLLAVMFCSMHSSTTHIWNNSDKKPCVVTLSRKGWPRPYPRKPILTPQTCQSQVRPHYN